MKTILAAIDGHRPGLVVMGTHGRGASSRLMFGPVAKAVLRATSVPVVAIDRVDVP